MQTKALRAANVATRTPFFISLVTPLGLSGYPGTYTGSAGTVARDGTVSPTPDGIILAPIVAGTESRGHFSQLPVGWV